MIPTISAISIPVLCAFIIFLVIVKFCVVTRKQRSTVDNCNQGQKTDASQNLVVPRIHITDCPRQRPPSLGDLPPSYNRAVDLPPWTRTGVSQDIAACGCIGPASVNNL